jgi:RNA polymerase sigma-70 factor (ECF subfamily)
MDPETTGAHREDVNAHDAWLLRVARAIARGDLSAEDLAQDAWLVALGGARPTGPLRAWLAGILHNLARSRRRAERSKRELGPTPLVESAPSSHDVVARADLRNTVRLAIDALPEPFRETIELRFIDELSHGEIATRLSVPIATVRTRLRLGLERLKTQLGRRRLGVLLPLAGLGKTGEPASPAAALRPAYGLLAGAMLAAVTVLVFLTGGSPLAAAEAAASRSLDRSRDPLAMSPAARPNGTEPTRTSQRQPVFGSTSAPAGADSTTSAVRRVASGRVVDLAGLTVAGVPVNFHVAPDAGGPSALARSVRTDAEGRFEIELGDDAGRLASGGDGWTHVLGATVFEDFAAEGLTLCVARACPLSGTVVDGDGRGVVGASVRVLLARDPRKELNADLDVAESLGWSCTTDANGGFALDAAPQAEGTAVRVERVGFAAALVPLKDLDRGRALIELRAVTASETLIGHVVDAAGESVPHAWVAVDDSTVRCDERGQFQIDLGNESAPRRVVAVSEGYHPAVLSLDRPPAGELELTLERAALAIAGTVVDGEGTPIPGALVWRCEGTRFGWLPVNTGGYVRKGKVDTELITSGQEHRSKVTADANGRFRLDGLLARGYRVAVFDPRTLVLATVPDVEAGSEDVVVTVNGGAKAPPLRGRVVDLEGQPVAGIRVVPTRRLEADERSECMLPTAAGHAVRTAADGTFSFDGVARRNLIVNVDGGARYTRTLYMAPPDGTSSDYIVPRQCRLTLAAPVAESITRFEVLDASGRQLAILRYDAGLESWAHSAFLRDGRSDQVLVAETARTVVLFDGASERMRVPALLSPTQATVVAP